jgi:broad specificity phosphatase PhoE
MHLHVVRHGETNANFEGRYLGALDMELNSRGESQAEELRARLPAKIDAVFVSPLLRAQQTAKIMFRDELLQLNTINAFRERSVGVFEGLTQAQARTQYPSLWSRNITRQWGAAPINGETISDVVSRVGSQLNALITSHAGKIVVLVAHGFVSKTIRALARQDFADFFDWQLGNGESLELTLLKQLPLDLTRLEHTLPTP